MPAWCVILDGGSDGGRALFPVILARQPASLSLGVPKSQSLQTGREGKTMGKVSDKGRIHSSTHSLHYLLTTSSTTALAFHRQRTTGPAAAPLVSTAMDAMAMCARRVARRDTRVNDKDDQFSKRQNQWRSIQRREKQDGTKLALPLACLSEQCSGICSCCIVHALYLPHSPSLITLKQSHKALGKANEKRDISFTDYAFYYFFLLACNESVSLFIPVVSKNDVMI